MHTAPPATYTPYTQSPRRDNDFLQHSPGDSAKYQQPESASWSARHHPFGEGYGQTGTGTVFGPVQGRKHGLPYLKHDELQMQTLHPARDREVNPHHQPGTLQTKAGIPNQPQRTTHRADGNRGNPWKTHDTRHAQGDIEMALPLSPSQAFVQDPEGKTHVILFHPQDSIAKNLLRHSS